MSKHLFREIYGQVRALHHVSRAEFRWMLERIPSRSKPLLKSWIDRRSRHEPLQYILGDQPFLGLDIRCKAPTLIPRPETEQMTAWICMQIEQKHYSQQYQNVGTTYKGEIPILQNWTKRRHMNSKLDIIDVFSGSGCIGLGLAHILGNDVHTLGLEIAECAIDLSIENAEKCGLRMQCHFEQVDIRDKVRLELALQRRNFLKADLVVANPPYIGQHEHKALQPEVQYEDIQALFAADNGLALYRPLIALAKRVLPRDAISDTPQLVFEFGGDHQIVRLQHMLDEAGFHHHTVHTDFYGRTRWMAASCRSFNKRLNL